MDPVFALFAAVDRGDLDVARALLRDSPTAVFGRFHGATALHRAAARGDTAMLELLLERGAIADDADESGATALAWATDEGADTAVDVLLDHGARASAVDLAARGRTLELQRALEQEPWMLDLSTAQGTPLHAAIRRGRVDAVELLLARGADVRRRDDDGRTAAELAADQAEPKVRALIEAALAREPELASHGWPADMPASDGVRYRCGACAEEIVIEVDRTEGEQQRFVEDCPVCCRANVIDVQFDGGQPARVQAELE